MNNRKFEEMIMYRKFTMRIIAECSFMLSLKCAIPSLPFISGWVHVDKNYVFEQWFISYEAILLGSSKTQSTQEDV